MTAFEVLKDIVVPIASPLVAAIAIIYALRSEGLKLRLQRDHERSQMLDSIFTDALFARDQFNILIPLSTQGDIPAVHVQEFKATFDRIYNKLFSDYRAGEELTRKVRYDGQKSNIFLLLAELRSRVISMTPQGSVDPFIVFGINTLLYLYDADDSRREAYYEVIELMKNNDPEVYAALAIDMRTPSLNHAA